MKAFYSNHYVIDLPPGHRFPIGKYSAIRNRLVAEEVIDPAHLGEPEPAAGDDILRVHTQDYYQRLLGGRLTDREVRRLGLPWSRALVLRSLVSVSGTISAAASALDRGLGINLGGGTHHAFADRGEGFCVLNDIAIAIRRLFSRGAARRAAVIDCDVHQGNGTAAILGDDPEVFTLSIHGETNYPLMKQQSTLDIGLPDGVGDEEYLSALDRGLWMALERFRPDIVFYQAGVDPYADDRLGRLSLSIEGLLMRDRRVFEACGALQIPCVVTLGGGYARNISDTVQAHCNTVRAAIEARF